MGHAARVEYACDQVAIGREIPKISHFFKRLTLNVDAPFVNSLEEPMKIGQRLCGASADSARVICPYVESYKNCVDRRNRFC
jgi:hypothetical protein